MRIGAYSANFLSRTVELNCAYVHFLGHMALLTVEKSMLLHVKSEYKKVRRSFDMCKKLTDTFCILFALI